MRLESLYSDGIHVLEVLFILINYQVVTMVIGKNLSFKTLSIFRRIRLVGYLLNLSLKYSILCWVDR